MFSFSTKLCESGPYKAIDGPDVCVGPTMRTGPMRLRTGPMRLHKRGLATFLDRRAANFKPLNPLTFLSRTASIFPSHTAIVYDDWKGRLGSTDKPAFTQTWAETADRVTRLASGLSNMGVGRGDTVAILSPNTPAFVETHHGVNAAGGVVNPLNTRLDAGTLAYILDHSDCKVLLADTGFAPTTKAALDELAKSRGNTGKPLPIVVDLFDPIEAHMAQCTTSMPVGDLDYESLLASGTPEFAWMTPEDEWESQALNYTSGTTGRPKGVLYHHRGAALNAINNSLIWGLEMHPTYLWTLPMFHCNGWCFPYTITMQAGTHVCLRTTDATSIFSAIGSQGVSHMCGAPVVMNMMLHAAPNEKKCLEQRDKDANAVKMLTAGAPPPAAVIQGMEGLGFDITHVYGLTEVYGPAVSCPWQGQWDSLSAQEKASIKARQGVKYPLLEELKVAELGSVEKDVPMDGETMGEILLKGNVVMKGYLKDEAATEKAFEGGWFHSGDLAVVHENGYIEIRDRAKDIIISGGENISTVEVEGALYRHPSILEASVVARPHEKWGETPCAFVVLKDGETWGKGEATEASVIAFCRDNLAHFKAPKHVVHMSELPKTSTGKVQKFELRKVAKDMADDEDVKAAVI